MKMPDLATTGSPMKVIRWLVDPGQPSGRGDPLLEVETDKAVLQVESVLSGRLSSVSAGEGDEVEAGEPSRSSRRTRPSRSGCRRRALRRPARIAVLSPPSAASPPAPVGDVVLRAEPAGPQPRRAEPGQAGRRRSAADHRPDRSPAGRGPSDGAEQADHPPLLSPDLGHAEPMVARGVEASGSAPIAWDAFFVHAAGKALRQFERLNYRFEDDRLIAQGPDAVGLAVDLQGDLFTLAIEHPAEKVPRPSLARFPKALPGSARAIPRPGWCVRRR